MTRNQGWLGLALACVTACRIPDETFTPIGDRSDGGVDGGDTDAPGGDAGTDAPPTIGHQHGWVLDLNLGLFHVNKNNAGDLTYDNQPATATGPSSIVALTDRPGRYIYVFGGNAAGDARQFPVTAGTLGSGSSYVAGGCEASGGAVTGATDFVVVGCRQEFVVARIGANGALEPNPLVVNVGTGLLYPAVDPTGTCIVIADQSAGVGSAVRSYRYDGTTVIVADSGTFGPTNPRAIAAHPSAPYVYAAGNSSVISYSITTSCGLSVGAIPGSVNGAEDMAVDPLGRWLFVAGDGVHVFAINASGMASEVSGSPFLQSQQYTDVAFDPALPDVVYLTARTGTHPADVDAQGRPTARTGPIVPTSTPVDFVMTP